MAVLEREAPPAPPGPPVQALYLDGAMVPLVGGVWGEVKTLAVGTVERRESGSRPRQEVRTTDLSYFSRMTDHETFTRLALVETHRRGTETAGVVCAVSDGAVWIQGVSTTIGPMRCASWTGRTPLSTSAWWPRRSLAWRRRRPPPGWPSTKRRYCTATRRVPDQSGRPARGGERRGRRQSGTPGVDGGGDPPLQGVLGRAQHSRRRRWWRRASSICASAPRRSRYAAFRTAHYPIGSGSVESANKLLVEARLKGAGMRWAPASVNPMVALRTVA